jgi:hypothetical protein
MKGCDHTLFWRTANWEWAGTWIVVKRNPAVQGGSFAVVCEVCGRFFGRFRPGEEKHWRRFDKLAGKAPGGPKRKRP